jgi:hypothetical protein
VDSFGHSLEKPKTLWTAYSLINRIRLVVSERVLAEAEQMLGRITEQYFAPNLTLEELKALALRRADPLKSFGVACRAEIKSIRASV